MGDRRGRSPIAPTRARLDPALTFASPLDPSSSQRRRRRCRSGGQGRHRRGHQVQGVAQDPPPRRPHPVPGPQGARARRAPRTTRNRARAMRATETTRGPRVPTLPRRDRVPRAARVARIRQERSLRFSPPRPWIGRASWQEAGTIKIPPSRATLTSAPLPRRYRRVTPPTSSSRTTAPSRSTASTPCALTLAASCPGTRPRTSSSAPATAPSTTTRVR